MVNVTVQGAKKMTLKSMFQRRSTVGREGVGAACLRTNQPLYGTETLPRLH